MNARATVNRPRFDAVLIGWSKGEKLVDSALHPEIPGPCFCESQLLLRKSNNEKIGERESKDSVLTLPRILIIVETFES